jgi:hypothetical protein
MKIFVSLLLSILAFGAIVRAESIARDLGRGLAYYRVRELPADLPTAESARRRPCVLDLRYVHGDATAAATLAAWLKFHATPRAPVFILANVDTGRALLAPLTGRDPAGSIVLIGAAAPGFIPDITVKISPDAERHAYDALATGTSVDSLLVENLDKPRNDEARLAKDHLPDSALAEGAPASGTPAADDAGNSAKQRPSAPLVDAALQRAVQLHRALVALKKI